MTREPPFVVLSLVAIWVISFLLTTQVWRSDFGLFDSPREATFDEQTVERPIFVFLQVSDTHITHSATDNGNAVRNFRRFVRDVVDIVEPRVVIATGDLTNAKHSRASWQSAREWETYRDTLDASVAVRTNRTAWLDLRGNHDTFGAGSWYTETNMYRVFGKAAHEFDNDGSPTRVKSNEYAAVARDGQTDRYKFVGVDATVDPGTHRPANFFGYLGRSAVQELKETLSAPRNFTGTVLYGHYPPCTIEFQETSLSLADVVAGSGSEPAAYFSGHLHTLLDKFPQGIKAAIRRPVHYLELESADLWTSSAFRLCAFQGGTLSYVDLRLPEETHTPVWVLLLNPPGLGPVHRQTIEAARTSTSLRFLLFTPEDVDSQSVSVHIDDVLLGKVHAVQGEENAYFVSWRPNTYRYGTHSVRISVHGRVVSDAKFSLELSVLRRPEPLQRIAEATLALTRFPRMIQHIVFGATVWIGCALFLGPVTRIQSSRPTYVGRLLAIFQLGVPSRSMSSLYKVSRSTWRVLALYYLYVIFGPVVVSPAMTEPSEFGYASLWGILYFGNGSRGLLVDPRTSDQCFIVLKLLSMSFIPCILAFALTAHGSLSGVGRRLATVTQAVLLGRAWQYTWQSARAIVGSHGILAFAFSSVGLPQCMTVMTVSVATLVSTTKLLRE